MKRQFTFDYEKYQPVKELPDADREVVEAAREAARRAWAPYSGFRVGAAARLTSGIIITGSNQESEVFPAGLCAERTLLFSHMAQAPEDKIVALAIASDPDASECYPCGICRQSIMDAQRRQASPIKVIMSSGTSATVVEDAGCLMPFSFGLQA